jgi:glycerol-3-phosphate acyltransferase PlsX
MKIIVDAMGGDNAPDEIVSGALDAALDADIDITLVGRGEDILRAIERKGLKELPRGIEIANATEVIEIEDDPATAVRTKKDSSMTVALNMLRDGHGDAFVSAGSTGAILSGATLIVKRVRGIRRAAMAPVIPNGSGGFILIDCGANTECTPEYLLQFAYMGSFYAEDVLSLSEPRVGLLSNGTERTKGTPLQIETYALLEKAHSDGSLNFIGSIEAKEALKGGCDVLVCDGFTGNILLKSIEGTASLIMSELKSLYTKNLVTKISALIVRKHMQGLRTKMNPDTVGGTAMLGISKPVIKAHGHCSKASG